MEIAYWVDTVPMPAVRAIGAVEALGAVTVWLATTW
jgi:hypothetical protein